MSEGPFKPEDFNDDAGGYGPYCERLAALANKRYRELHPKIPDFKFNAVQIDCIVTVADHFKDLEKTALWFNIPNPLLGEIRPAFMLLSGREEKLLKFLINCREGNMA